MKHSIVTRSIFQLSSIAFGLLLAASVTHAATITVCPSGCDQTTVSGALLAANPGGGDTVDVHSDYDPSADMTWPLGFPSASTTLQCDVGATIGQADLTGNDRIELSDHSTVRGCAFGNITLESVLVPDGEGGFTGPTGIRIENNIFSQTATSTINFVNGAIDFLIQGNENIAEMTTGIRPLTNGQILNNLFYGHYSRNTAAYMLELSATSSDAIQIVNNVFESHTISIDEGGVPNTAIALSGSDYIFATNTIRYVDAPPEGVLSSVAMSSQGENYVGGNKVESSFASGSVGISVAPAGEGVVTASYIIDHDTFYNRAPNGVGLSVDDSGNDSAIIMVTSTNSLFDGGGANPDHAILVNKNATDSVLKFVNDRDGYYGFTQLGLNQGAAPHDGFSAGEKTYNRKPFFMTGDDTTANDLDIAPFSFYLDLIPGHEGDGALNITGATTSSRRNGIHIDVAGPVDYSTIDSTTTADIPEFVESGDTITVATGTYSAFEIDNSDGNDHIIIHGSGTGTIINAHEDQDGIDLANMNTSTLSDLVIQNASSSATTYAINRIVFNAGGFGYGEPIDGFGLPASSTLLFTDGSCDIQPYHADGQDVTALVNGTSQNWHVALATVAGSRETVVVPGDFASSGSDIEAACSGGGPPVSVVTFISDVFLRSGSTFTYNPTAVSDAGAAQDGSLTTPAIASLMSGHVGLKITNSQNILIQNVTSTDNGTGISFADTSAWGNTLDTVAILNSHDNDVRMVASGANTFQNVLFNRASTTITGDGPIDVLNSLRTRALDASGLAPISGVHVTTTAADTSVVGDDVTDDSGYTPFFLSTDYRMTSTTQALTNGGYNPFTFTAGDRDGFHDTSTVATVSSPFQTVTLAMVSTAPPAAPSDVGVGTVSTTRAITGWSDNSSNEDAFVVDLIDVSAGQTFPGTLRRTSANTTSFILSSLTPSEQYQVRVASTNINATSTYATSSIFTTLPMAPLAPTVTANGRTAVNVVINTNGNGSTTRYAIYDVTNGTYLDLSGAATSSPAWNTSSTWGTLAVSGLSCGTAHEFSTVAENLDDAESAASTSAAASTDSCPVVTSHGGGGGGGGSLAPVVSTNQVATYQNGQLVTSTTSGTSSPVTTTSPSTSPTPNAPAPTTNASTTVPMLPPTQDLLDKVKADAKEFHVTLTDDQAAVMAQFIQAGLSRASIVLGERERRAVVRDYLDTMQRGANTMDDLDRMCNGLIPLQRNLSAERAQLPLVRRVFVAIMGHAPNFHNVKDNLAWNTFMYRLRFPRVISAEQGGVVSFQHLFRRAPRTPFDWAAVRVLGYVKP